MKTRTTLILLALALAAAAYLYFVERDKPGTEEAQRQAQNVVNFDNDEVEGIRIQSGDEKIELRRDGDKWRIESPIKDQADAAAINQLLYSLEDWRKENTIPKDELDKDRGRLQEYGLQNAKLRLKLVGKEMPPEIFFGNDAAFENQMYVRLADSRETYIVPKNVRQEIEKKPEDFRDKRLTDLSPSQVTRVIVRNPAGEMELQKTGEEWQIVKPLKTRADPQKVNDLLAQATTARIEKFVAEDTGNLTQYGLAEPRGAITLFGENDEQGKMMQLGSVVAPENKQVHIRFAPRSAVYLLPKHLEEAFNAKPDDVRDRHLVRIDENILDRITIEAPGRGKTVLARKEESWNIVNRNNQPANTAEVRRFLENLRNEQVVNFVDHAADLARYGLDKPQLIVTLSSFASENTAESQAGEQPFVTIFFGRQEGETVFARVNDEPFVMAVRRQLPEQIPADPLQWQPLTIFNLKPEQIQKLTRTMDKEVALVRGGADAWTAPPPATEAVDQVNAKSLINTLANLRAASWAGTAVAQHGFDKPTLTISFEDAEKKPHKLTVGARTENKMWFAKSDDHEGTFVLSQPDYSALSLPLLVETPASPAPQSDAPSPAGPPASSPSPPVSPAPEARSPAPVASP